MQTHYSVERTTPGRPEGTRLQLVRDYQVHGASTYKYYNHSPFL
jgi:hypothetical protein